MINSTVNLKLKKPDDLESFDVEHMNFNSDTIDKAVGNLSTLKTAKKDNLVNAVNEVKEGLSTLKLESTAIDVVDTANNFNADSHGKKLLEDVLVQLDTKAKEAFQGADSGKKIIATAIGSPLSDADTFSEMGNKIDLITDKFKTYLKSAGVIVPDDIKMNVLINRIKDIQVKKYTMKEKFMPKAFELRTVETLPYAFINGVYYEKGDYLTYFGGKVGKYNYDTNNKKITINKYTLSSVQEINLGYSQIYADTIFNNVYVKLKQEDNIAIYEYSNNLRLLDINTHVKEEVEIPSRDRLNGNVSVCKTDDNTSIYVLGGCYYPSSSQVEKYTEVRSFDPLTKTWTRKNDLNASVANCVSIKVGNFIYSFHNGFKDVDKVKKLVRYDLLTQTSTILKQGVDLQMPNVDFAYAPFDYFVQNNIIYILTKDGLYIYNINKNTLEFVKITSIGDKYNYMLSNYFIFNCEGVFYKCCGQENHVLTSYDPIFINTIQMVSIIKE